MTRPYGEAAWLYRGAGWAGVLPLPAGAKTPPPGGFTGWAGVEPSGADVQGWIDHGLVDGRPAGNIALRLPAGVYGLDVDDYGAKSGGAALGSLTGSLGALPPTWIVSSREESTSGIRLFRAVVPVGRRWRNEPAGHGAGIESIHRGHRYAVVWPSTHPETGNKYQWRRPDGITAADGELPSPTTLPELPAAWVEALSEPGEVRTGDVAGHAETIERVTGWREDDGGSPCPPVVRAAERALGALSAAAAGAPLHPAVVTATHELASLGHEGHAGVRRALAEHYVAATEVRAARGDDRGKAEAEWWRAVRGAVGKLAGPARERCDCDVWAGAGLLFEPDPEPWPTTLHASPEAETTGPVGPSGSVYADASPEREANGLTPDAPAGRRVDLSPWLTGSFAPPQPSVGARRDDLRHLLYPGRWHTVIGPTAAGKSWLALIHARDEIVLAGRPVVYLHFEETLPSGTVARLLALDIPAATVAERFVWLSCERMWERGELAVELARVRPGLVVLDGINAACTRHGFDPSAVEAVGWYRDRFVSPSTAVGAAVLSLGHPPKARDRQDERHGFGSTAWLDEVDGVGFRLIPARGHPIGRNRSGSAALSSVKDRYGEVERLGRVSDGVEGWTYLGSVVVDDSAGRTTVRITAPEALQSAEGGPPRDGADDLADRIVELLSAAPGRDYASQSQLMVRLRAVHVPVKNADVPVALERLEGRGVIEREPDRGARCARAGWLTRSTTDSGVDHDVAV